MINKLRNHKAVKSTEWLIKNAKIIPKTFAMIQEFYNLQGKVLRNPKSELEKNLCSNMCELGYEIN